MRYLLDTHTLLWSQDDTSKLPVPATTALSDPANERFLSVATIWEISIKAALGKLVLSKPFRIWVESAINDLVLTILPITLDHIERQIALPFHHRDPFDRMLAAQSFCEAMTLISSDTIFDAYGVQRLWS